MNNSLKNPRQALIASLSAIAALLLIIASNVIAADEPNGSFPDDSLSSWKEKSFSGKTRYELVQVADQTVLKASTNQSASVLYKQKTINLQKTPWLEWTWKIDSIYQDIDERTKSGDDFPARLYIAVQTGFMPWNTVAINYVWSSNQVLGSVWANPFTSKSIMVAVQAGSEKTGQWVTQRRNVAEDFKTLFDLDVTKISGYAVMVDGDNSGQISTAYFGQIDFSAQEFSGSQ